MRTAILTALSLIALTVAQPAAAQIDTRTGGEPDSSYGLGWYLADGSAFSAGQTFKSFAATPYLNRFSFFVTNGGQSNDFQFRAYIREWNEGSMGAELYRSDAAGAPEWNPFDIPTEYSFDTGSLYLDPTKTYAAFLSVLEETNPGPGHASYLAAIPASAYTDGMAIGHVGSDFASLAENWAYDAQYDLPFTADFSASATATPEPVTMTLLGTGLAGIAAARRRRKQD